MALQFSKDFFGLGPDRYVDYVNEDGTEGGRDADQYRRHQPDVYLHVVVILATSWNGPVLKPVWTGGLNEVVKIYGSDVKKYLIAKATVTRWGEHPWTLGSYASAKPGYFHMRKELA